MRSLLGVPLLAAGAASGVAALAIHGYWWGLVLAAAATLAVMAALPGSWWGRTAFAVGWEVPVLGAGLRRGPGGDVAVAADVNGYGLLLVALVVALGAVLSLARPASGRDESTHAGSSA